MVLAYEYTPYLWLILASVVFLVLLGIKGIRHRSAPGALPFITAVAVAIPWVLANGLGLASTDDATSVFWWNVQIAFLLPIINASVNPSSTVFMMAPMEFES